MSVILAWCKRHQEIMINLNIVSFTKNHMKQRLKKAKDTNRSIEEHPRQKGVYRLEYTNQKQMPPDDVLMLGSEVSGADNQGHRLMIQKGFKQ